MLPVLTEQQIDQLDNIFAYDKASALRNMRKSGLFRKAVLPIDAVDKKGKGAGTPRFRAGYRRLRELLLLLQP